MSSHPLEYLTCTVKDVTFRLVKIPAGSFMMGSDKGYGTEIPIRPVQVPAFWLAEYPCTQALYQAVTDRKAITGQWRTSVGTILPITSFPTWKS